MVDAIETKAYGCRFRSRLEARWAVFLSALAIEWDYEREGYVIDGTPYLPDFWLPYPCSHERSLGWGEWLEIKPTWPLTEAQEALYAGLAKETGHRLYAACGSPWDCRFYIFNHHHGGTPNDIPICTDARLIQNRFTGEVELYSPASRVVNWLFTCKFGGRGTLIQAQQQARSARFEYGEAP